jgi:hypothetical protein
MTHFSYKYKCKKIISKIIAHAAMHKREKTCLNWFYSRNARVFNIQNSFNVIPTSTKRKKKRKYL